MRSRYPVVVAVALAVTASVCVVPARAAGRPSVTTAVDGRESGTGRALVTLIGKKLMKVSAIDVLDGAQLSVGAADLVSRSGTHLVVRLPEGLDPGTYTLAVTAGNGEPLAVPLRVQREPLLTDGTNAMTGALRSTSNDGVVFGGTSSIGGDPPSGAGSRMVWYPKKSAFRAGGVNGDEWDPANIGDSSAALGFGCVASGGGAIALGDFASATRDSSIALGDHAVAAGSGSIAIGPSANAEEFASVAIGYRNHASGRFAFACGSDTVAQAYGSFVVGTGNVVAGTANPAVAADPLFVCGNGTPSARSNALTLLRNGDLTISGTLTQNSDARLKTDVTALVGVSERLAKLHGVSYSFADPTKHPEGRHIGLLAQEVRAAFPELVTEGPDGTLSVAYGNFAAVLLEAVKEQSAEVTALRKEHAARLASRDAEIAALREAQSALAERLARLEAAGAK